ncbi:putative transporter slc-17.2 [Branchiostoma floridae x Branchiostoma japonicum]
MVNSSSPVNQTDTYQLCPSSGTGNTSAQNDQGELDWSESIQGVLLGSYFYGYIVTQVLGGLLEQRFGGKIVYGTSMLVTGALNALSPVASRTSPWAMFAVRFSMRLVSNVELAGSKDLVIANEHAEMPTKVVEMPSTKL